MFKSKLLVIAFVLFLVWVGAFFAFHVVGFLLRVLLILAIVFFIAHFLSKRKRT